ncbi:MAG TPA: Ku protein [Dehalococcoidia bacterium]|nr:Ku protein [Dehalococcoidia bacterium]
MPRPLWKGAISFGMVTIPVKLYSATDEKDVRFNQLHRTDHSRIRQKIFCAEEDIELDRDDIVKGYQIAPGQYVVLEDEDFDKVPVSTTRTIEIAQFVDLSEIDPIYYQKTYYLEPDEVGMKPFALLMAALNESKRVAIAKISMRQKEHLCTLRVYENTIALETMFYADEVRSTADLTVPGEDVQVSERELQMARSLIDMLTEELDLTQFRDNYREALLEVIRAKAQGQTIEAPQPAVAKVTDLMEALRASVEAAKARRQASAPEKAEAPRQAEEEDELSTRRKAKRKAS